MGLCRCWQRWFLPNRLQSPSCKKVGFENGFSPTAALRNVPAPPKEALAIPLDQLTQTDTRTKFRGHQIHSPDFAMQKQGGGGRNMA